MELLDFCKTHEKLFIYGAGNIGKKLYGLLKVLGITIQGFLVSSVSDPKELEHIPVNSFAEWNQAAKHSDAGIIVAVSASYREEILKTLSKSGCKNVFSAENDTFLTLYRNIHPVNPSTFLSVTSPVSDVFGFDRGTPIDRYYIEKFLQKESSRVSDVINVLEVEETTYSQKYFPNGNHDVLHYDKGMDLTNVATLPQGKYDLFICTQVFNFIYDVKAAIKGSHFLLRNGGTLLATIAAQISPVSQYDMKRWGHYWGFTTLGIRKLMEEIFGHGAVKIIPFGNALAATAFVQGLSVEDLPDAKLLDVNDPNYAIAIGVVAKKGH